MTGGCIWVIREKRGENTNHKGNKWLTTRRNLWGCWAPPSSFSPPLAAPLSPPSLPPTTTLHRTSYSTHSSSLQHTLAFYVPPIMADAPPDASNPRHPPCILRLASAVHRFRLPNINPADQLSFEASFKTCSSSHSETIAVMHQVRGSMMTFLDFSLLLTGDDWFILMLLITTNPTTCSLLWGLTGRHSQKRGKKRTRSC